MMDAVNFQEFLSDLQGDVADILDTIYRLVLEAQTEANSNYDFGDITMSS